MSMTIYQERRKKLGQILLEKKGIAFIPANNFVIRSHDTEYEFRQDSNFHYLTGYPESDALLVLMTKEGEIRSTLFVLEKDPLKEQWTGIRIGKDKAKEDYLMDETFDLKEFPEKLEEMISGHKGIISNFFDMSDPLQTQLLKTCHNLSSQRRKKTYIPTSFFSLREILGQMRLIKDEAEIGLIRKSAEISAKAHRAAMAFTQQGRNESEVSALIDYIFKMEGAASRSYNTIVAGGNHANVLHYIENNAVLKKGELLLIDAGCEFKGYASDITRTFPVHGQFTGASRDVYDLVLTAQKEAIQKSNPRTTLTAIHNAVINVLTQGLIDLGIFQGSLNENLEKENLKKYYPHGTSHWMGLDVHDPCPYKDEKMHEISLEKGMIYTVEPGLYFPEDDESLPKAFRGIGVRIEDDILITENSCENLTSLAPKEILDIEKAYSEDYRSYL